MFPLINFLRLDLLNLYLMIEDVAQDFIVAVIKPLIPKPDLDLGSLVKSRSVSNILFISKYSSEHS